MAARQRMVGLKRLVNDARFQAEEARRLKRGKATK